MQQKQSGANANYAIDKDSGPDVLKVKNEVNLDCKGIEKVVHAILLWSEEIPFVKMATFKVSIGKN